MNKKRLCQLCTALLLSSNIYGTALAAEATLPADHWTYKAIHVLESSNIIPAQTKPETPLTRSEMAGLVEKAMENSSQANPRQKALIDKLAVEFALEINGIALPPEKAKSKANDGLKIGFDTLMTVSSDTRNPKVQGNDMWHWRARLTLDGNLNDNTAYHARLGTSFGTAGMTTSANSSGTVSGNYLAFDRVYFDSKNVLGFDNISWGRRNINELGGNLAYKTGNNDGVVFTKFLSKNTKMDLGAFVVKPETTIVGTSSGDTQDVQFVAVTSDLSPKWRLGGMLFNNNTDGKSAAYGYTDAGSKIGAVSARYKVGKFTILGEFDQASLDNPVHVSSRPHAFAIQVTNGKKAGESFYPVAQTVTDINQKGDQAFVFSYRQTQKGAVPLGLGPWGGATIVSPVTSTYNNGLGVDNIKGFYFSYQYVLAKGVELSFDTQFLSYTDSGSKFDNIYMFLLNTRF